MLAMSAEALAAALKFNTLCQQRRGGIVHSSHILLRDRRITGMRIQTKRHLCTLWILPCL